MLTALIMLSTYVFVEQLIISMKSDSFFAANHVIHTSAHFPEINAEMVSFEI